MRRYRLRLDGFVSVHAGGEEAEMVTKPLVFGGKALELNLATSAAGSVRVEIQAEDGAPVPGFALEDCPPILGDSVDQIVSWEGGTDLSHLAGKPVRLRFALVDVDLYAMRFPPETPDVAFAPQQVPNLIVNAAGEIYDAVDGNARWNASATVAVGKNAAENTWTVEVALPWRDLGVEPACGMICRGNLGRENMTQGGAKWFENNECSSWCRVVTGGLNSPGSMGVFILE